MFLRNVLSCAALILGAATSAYAMDFPQVREDGVLTVQVGNVTSAKGMVRVDVCGPDQFLKSDCAFSGEAPASVGVTTVEVRHVPPGTYAVQAYHDENDNGHVDRTLGIPKEGVGFSNDPHLTLSAPKFADASFRFCKATPSISVGLRHYLR